MTGARPPTDWICRVCGGDNPASNPVCYCCRVPRDGSEEERFVERPRPAARPPRPASNETAIVGIALLVAAVATFFVQPGVGILLVLLSLPLLAMVKPRGPARGCLTAIAIASGAVLAAIGAFFVTCFAVVSLPDRSSEHNDSWGRWDLALVLGLVVATLAAIAVVWGLVAKRTKASRTAEIERIHEKARRIRMRIDRERASGGPPPEEPS